MSKRIKVWKYWKQHIDIDNFYKPTFDVLYNTWEIWYEK